MLQADNEDDLLEMQMKTPFGSSFRTFNATDYKPIGKTALRHTVTTVPRALHLSEVD
jgi:HIV-1 Vpr-binding protein